GRELLLAEHAVDERPEVPRIELAQSRHEDRGDGDLAPHLREVRILDLERHDRLRGGVLEQTGKVLAQVEGAHLNDRSTESPDREERDRVGGTVRQVEGDAVSGSHPFSGERGGEALTRVPEFPITPLRTVVDDRGSVGPTVHA